MSATWKRETGTSPKVLFSSHVSAFLISTFSSIFFLFSWFLQLFLLQSSVTGHLLPCVTRITSYRWLASGYFLLFCNHGVQHISCVYFFLILLFLTPVWRAIWPIMMYMNRVKGSVKQVMEFSNMTLLLLLLYVYIWGDIGGRLVVSLKFWRKSVEN